MLLLEILPEAFEELPIPLWDIEPLPMGKEPLPFHIVQQLRQVGKPGEERQGIVLDLPGNLLDRAFPLQPAKAIAKAPTPASAAVAAVNPRKARLV